MIAKELILTNEWVEVYSQLGVDNVNDIFIQNKSSGSVYIWPKNDLPLKSTDGLHLKIGDTTVINSQGENLYIKGLGSVFVSKVTITSAAQSSVEINNTAVNPVPVSFPASAAQDGTDATGVPAPAGASGIRGWLSGIYSRLAKGVGTAANSLSVAQASDNVFAVSGSAPVGTTPTAPPLSTSGVDDGGLKRHFHTDNQGNLYVVPTALRSTQVASIAAGANVSGTIDLMRTAFLGFVAPSGWTTAALNIEVSTDNTNWSSLYDAYGSVSGSLSTLVAGAAYATDMVSLLPFRYVRLRSGTSASPVNQTIQRDFKIITRELA